MAMEAINVTGIIMWITNTTNKKGISRRNSIFL